MKSFVPSTNNTPLFWPKVEFSLFLFGQILSIPCYLFVFYHILFDKIARQSLQNHTLIILLIYNFLNVTIDLSLSQDYTRLGYVQLFHPIVCLLWQYIDFGIWYGALTLMLWMSIERHILIFHSNFIRTTRLRILFHYIPLLIAAVYAPILYFYLIFLIPCERIYFQNIIQCSSPCFYSVVPTWVPLYDSSVNYIIPIVLIVLLNITLFLRVLKQKQRLKQHIHWRRYRKMLIQLFLVSTAYVIFDIPFVIISIVRWSGYALFAESIRSPYTMRLTFVPAIIVPYAVMLGLPQLRVKIRGLYFWKRNRR